MKKTCGPKRCPDCPFKSRTCGSRGPLDAKIVIVGESPGTEEIMRGVPFIGPSGRLLKKLLAEIELSERDIYFTNTLKCLPPQSKDKNGKSIKDAKMNDAAKACRQGLLDELAAYPRDLIITMGSAAAKTLLNRWTYSITKERGQLFTGATHNDKPLATHGVLPTLHPAYILRNPAATPQLRSDMEKVRRILNDEPFPKPEVSFKLLETPEMIREAILASLYMESGKRGPLRVIADIEATGLDRHRDAFRCIGFIFEHRLKENGKNLAYIVSGRNQGANVKFLFEELARASKKIKRTLEFVWHNGKLDTSFLRAKGIPRDQVRVDQDTLLLSYTLDETGGRHSLEQCIMDHLGLPSYKDKLKGKMKETGTDYRTIPVKYLYPYCAEDVVFTGLLFRKLHPQVVGSNRNSHLEKAYTRLMIPASNALATIELNGMPIDQEVLRISEKELEAKIEPIVHSLRKLIGKVNYNPNSPNQTLAVLRRMKLNVNSTKEDALKKHKGNRFVDLLLEYRGYQKLLSTYVRAFKKYDSRVHTSYLIHGTVTGRLSSTSPNMQNIPKEEIVRKHFRPRKGRVFVSFDYSQAELRSLAVLSGDKNLLELFRSGKDMHAAVAAKVYGELFTNEPEFLPNADPNIKIENPIYNKYRRNAKTVNFGIVYGATEPTLMERLGITWAEAHKLITGWFKMFPKAREYMDLCRASPKAGRPMVTVFGRERRFYVITDENKHGLENEAGNFPHQSMCSDFTLDAAIEIDRLHAKGVLPGNACQVNIIHDDNMFEIDDDDESIIALANIVRPIMEGVPRKHGITELTFKSDAKKGYNWSAMQKIKGL